MPYDDSNVTESEMPMGGTFKERLNVELHKLAVQSNNIAVKFVLILFLVPTLPDMFQFPEDWTAIFIGRLIVLPFMIGAWWLHRQGKIDGYWVGTIVFAIAGIHCGFIFKYGDPNTVLAINAAMFGFFIGTGFFVALKTQHISVFLLFSTCSMVIGVLLAEKYGFVEWVEQAAVLNFLGIALSLLSVQAKNKLQIRSISSQLALEDNQAVLNAKNTELETAKRQLESAKTFLEQKVEERTASLRKSHSETEAVIYRLSHDFKMPIVNVRSLLLMARAEAKGETIEKIFDMIESSLNTYDGVTKEMNRFVAFSTSEIALDHCSFEELLDEAWRKASQGMQPRMDLDIQGSSPAALCTDPIKLELVLDCVFRNAYQYRKDNEKGRVTISSKAEGKNLRIWVHDNGVGIQPEILPKVFDLFFRGNSRSKGLGIGLYLARGIMEQLKGQIEMSSDGEGTTATILLTNVYA